MKAFSLSALAVTLSALVACGGSGGTYNGDTASSSSSSSDTDSSSSETSSVSSSSSSSSTASGWSLVWADEFDDAQIDSTKWEHEVNCWGGGNNEQQCYTARNDNSFVEDGVLNIVAREEDYEGRDGPEGEGALKTLPYTSARLRTRNLAEWTFGRFEARIQLPEGQGTWPAFWMLPTDSPYGEWASGGEIDIVEAVNLKVNGEDEIHGTIHFGGQWPDNASAGSSTTLPDGANPADGFHEYAVEWEPGEIRWYVDGTLYGTQTSAVWYSDNADDNAPNAPFDEFSQFHLLMNLAVGGDWAANVNEGGIDSSVFPQTMLVDWVRVYECADGPGGCETPGPEPEPAGEYGQPPEFMMFEDTLDSGLEIGSYNPDGVMSHSTESELGRGDIITIDKAGDLGNFFFTVIDGPIDMSAWETAGDLVFDLRVNDNAAGSTVLVKMDSGWPSVSDMQITLPPVGEWGEIRLNVADLIASGNSIEPGMANATSIANPFVVEPSGAINISLDNVRFEQ